MYFTHLNRFRFSQSRLTHSRAQTYINRFRLHVDFVQKSPHFVTVSGFEFTEKVEVLRPLGGLQGASAPASGPDERLDMKKGSECNLVTMS